MFACFVLVCWGFWFGEVLREGFGRVCMYLWELWIL
jgi:hypothetical protein